MDGLCITRLKVAALAAVCLATTACGSGGGSSTAPTDSSAPPTVPTATTTAGVWKGTVMSTTTGQSMPLIALIQADGHSGWMAADGRVWSGRVPMSGASVSTTMIGHIYGGSTFPDGSNHGHASLTLEHHATGTMSGRYAGSGDDGNFDMHLSPMWNRPASLDAVAGVYTRSTSSGYTMTLTVGANGQLSGSDSRNCIFNGTIDVPDAMHNLYHVDATLNSCGPLDGHYRGMGTLLDADAMQDWMTAMHPLEHGTSSHGGSMMHGSHGSGHNTVPTGRRNLFVFCMANEQGAIMDALAR